MFSIMTMASSTTKPVEMVSAISDEVVERVAEQIHDAEGADDGERHGDGRDDGGGDGAQEEEDHHDHEPMVSSSSNLTSVTEARMVLVRSVRTRRSTPAGSDWRSLGRSACTRSTTPMMLAPGWR